VHLLHEEMKNDGIINTGDDSDKSEDIIIIHENLIDSKELL